MNTTLFHLRQKFFDATVAERAAMFVEWVMAQPAAKQYDYLNHAECPLAQFGRDLGFQQTTGTHVSFWAKVPTVFGEDKKEFQVLPSDAAFMYLTLAFHTNFGALAWEFCAIQSEKKN